jgi:hypothetical protein
VAKRGYGFFDSNGSFFQHAADATASDLSALVGRELDPQDIGHGLLKHRAEIERIFGEHDALIDNAAAHDGGSQPAQTPAAKAPELRPPAPQPAHVQPIGEVAGRIESSEKRDGAEQVDGASRDDLSLKKSTVQLTPALNEGAASDEEELSEDTEVVSSKSLTDILPRLKKLQERNVI